MVFLAGSIAGAAITAVLTRAKRTKRTKRVYIDGHGPAGRCLTALANRTVPSGYEVLATSDRTKVMPGQTMRVEYDLPIGGRFRTALLRELDLSRRSDPLGGERGRLARSLVESNHHRR